MIEKLHTSESVTEGHPDKVCDMIAAAVLDEAIIACDPLHVRPRVAMEVSAKAVEDKGTLMLFGEVSLPKGVSLDYVNIARNTLVNIGYNDQSSGFHADMQNIIVEISEQSENIKSDVSRKRTGAGDQGVMFGYATNETREQMPLPILLAHRLTDRYTQMYKNGLSYLRPDGKSQVTVMYENGIPKAIHNVVIAASHDRLADLKKLRQDVIAQVILPVFDEYGFGIEYPDKQIYVNGSLDIPNQFIISGPQADAGTTNRKIIVDSYGGAEKHGGGGLNGKDASKVDVAGPTGLRAIANGLVAEKLVKRVSIEVGYVISQPDPLAFNIETFNPDETEAQHRKIEQRAKELLDLSVDGIIEGLDLFQPIYRKAAVGGWFGRNEFPWEYKFRK